LFKLEPRDFKVWMTTEDYFTPFPTTCWSEQKKTGWFWSAHNDDEHRFKLCIN